MVCLFTKNVSGNIISVFIYLQELIGALLYHAQVRHHVGVRHRIAAEIFRKRLIAERAAEQILDPVLTPCCMQLCGMGRHNPIVMYTPGTRLVCVTYYYRCAENNGEATVCLRHGVCSQKDFDGVLLDNYTALFSFLHFFFPFPFFSLF